MTAIRTPESASCPSCGVTLVSAEEAARIVGVSYARIRAILSQNPDRLKAFRIGKIWVVPESAARNFKPLPSHRPLTRSRTS